MDLKNILTSLSLIPAPSGSESAAAEYTASLLPGFETKTDALGNLAALRRCGRPGAPLLMLEAHIDEVGFIITSVTDSGFLKFSTLGSPDFRVLPDSELLVLCDPPLPGIVSCLPPHVQEAGAMNKYAKVDTLAIDVGLSAAEARARIKPGTPAVNLPKSPLCLSNGRIGSKAMDNRLSAAIILKALEDCPDAGCDILAAFCVQEEAGCRGAGAVANAYKPDAAVILDVTFGESPDSHTGTFPLASGVTVCLGPYTDRRLSERLISACERSGAAWTPEVYGSSTGTDATPVQISGAGIPTAVLSVPLRYMHTPCEVADLSDIGAAAGALAEFIRSFGRNENA